ncbi:hypothetical protein B0H13DRAFT_2265647 [Mycena leptocephala]|nr:hypothetical protein B0H13DRAFT_2265647 [Mycena leptocephala]
MHARTPALGAGLLAGVESGLILELAYLGSLAFDNWRDSRLTGLGLACTGDTLLNHERLADPTPDTRLKTSTRETEEKGMDDNESESESNAVWHVWCPIKGASGVEDQVIRLVDPIWLGVQALFALQIAFPSTPIVMSHHTNLPTYAGIFGYCTPKSTSAPGRSTRICTLLRDTHSFLYGSRPTRERLGDPEGGGKKRRSGGVFVVFLPPRSTLHAPCATLRASRCSTDRSPSVRLVWSAAPVNVIILSVGRPSPEKNLRLVVWGVVRGCGMMRRVRAFTRLMRTRHTKDGGVGAFWEQIPFPFDAPLRVKRDPKQSSSSSAMVPTPTTVRAARSGHDFDGPAHREEAGEAARSVDVTRELFGRGAEGSPFGLRSRLGIVFGGWEGVRVREEQQRFLLAVSALVDCAVRGGFRDRIPLLWDLASRVSGFGARAIRVCRVGETACRYISCTKFAELKYTWCLSPYGLHRNSQRTSMMSSGLYNRASDAETQRQFGEILGGVSTVSNAARVLRKIHAKA